MSLQWTVVAVFLYAEIGFLALLLLPWIRPHMWNKILRSRLVRAISAYSNAYTWAGAGILVLFFFDAVREVRKYTNADMTADVHIANADAVIHMRLFRAQRNLYISGFALFLWLVTRRMLTLISHEAQLMATSEAAMKQAQSASNAAQAAMDGQGGNEEVKALTEKLNKVNKALKSAESDRDAMKEQSINLQQEYDRLSDAFNKIESGGKGDGKKDD